ncbi:hypothetical protein QBC32DRAFT_374650 [Pseudoneurospora amorphoporcata]|uniref:Uncharacterized protein n=1 Tax=Pseudoneurospora amorphoporcata TaxID=241081 RepID=A0AAN6SBB7_9PEZI|nr:hypothetical protein QBC32DRAFT_374650 [Pseudoneurospora amorphoporcata]
MEMLEVVAQFCSGVAGVSPSEEADVFTNDIINPYLDSAAPNTWQPAYTDLKSLTLTSKTLYNPAQRALFKVAVVNTTSGLMRLLRTLLQHQEKRNLVRCFIANIDDHMRPLPCTLISPPPLVFGEFLYYVYPILSDTVIDQLPAHSFFRRTVPLLKDIFQALNTRFKITLRLIESTEINLHTLEDQIMTATIQLLPNLQATRICFGTPTRHQARRVPRSQPSLTLDFSALLALTNFKRYVPGYPTGLPPSVERLTLIGSRTDAVLPFELFDLNVLSKWLSSNTILRELRMLDGFDRLIKYRRFRLGDPNFKSWNDVLLTYQFTLEVLTMGSYAPFQAAPQARYGPSGMLDCLYDMHKLRKLKVPLHALSGQEFGLPPGEDDCTYYMRTTLPPSLKKMEVMVMNSQQGASGEEGTENEWSVVEYNQK